MEDSVLPTEHKTKAKPKKPRTIKTESSNELSLVSGDGLQKSEFAAFFRALCEKNLKFMISQFAQRLEKNFKISHSKIVEYWNEVSAGSGLEIEANFSIPENSSSSPKSATCQHFMPRANRNCNLTVSKKSRTRKYCSQHVKYEDEKSDDQKQEQKKCEYVSKNGNRCKHKISEDDEESKYCDKHSPDRNSDEKSSENKKAKRVEKTKKNVSEDSEVILRPRKHSSVDVYFDASTNFVIDNETKKVYGRLESDTIIPLRKEDEEWLEKHHYDFRGRQAPPVPPE